MSKPSAYIHADAKIGKGTTIEPFTCIYEDVIIGENTWIGSSVTIFPGTRIGSNCKVFPGAVIGAEPQDLKFGGEYTTVEIGDGTSIRECVTIHRATEDKLVTKVGKNCLLMAYSHIAHDTWIGDNCVLANGVSVAGHVEIDDWAILEGLVAVQQFIKIGAHSFIAGASLVRKNIPPFVKAAREPISYVGVNTVGLKRRGFTDQEIRNIEDVYRLIFVQNQNITKGIEQVESELKESPQKSEILEFIKNSPKGVMKGIY
jgi:UDP-N-acetylglucosamine acyltransferase